MRNSVKRGPRLFAAVVSVCALMAVSASAASASNAWWVNPGGATASGTLTVKQAGANEKTCNPTSTMTGSAVNGESSGVKSGLIQLFNTLGRQAEYTCTGSTHLQIELLAGATYEAGFQLSFSSFTGSLPSPYGSYTQGAFSAPWTNGTGGGQSTFSLSNTKIGSNAGGDITASGTVTVKRNNGEVLSLTH